MKQYKNIGLLILGFLFLASCNKQILDKQANPNNPGSVPPSLILGTILTDISGSGDGSLGGINSWDDVHAWNQYHCQNYDYYGSNIYTWTNGSFDPYLVLKNVMKMENEASIRGQAAVNPYESVGRFVKAYYYYNLTSLFGDVPQEQALQAPQISSPGYSTQQKVFAYILSQLDTANTHLSTLKAANDNSLNASQDIYYHGDLSKWQRLVNSFKLRVLVALSKKASDAALNVPGQFAAIFNDPLKYPIFSSESDDLAFVYNPGGTNTFSTYPFNPSNYGSIAGRYNMASTYVGALTNLKDPRVFKTCEPAMALLGNNTDPCKFNYFLGASTGEPLSTMYPNANAGKYSYINRNRYYSNFTGEANVLLGYKEMCFNIAEAIERGWVAGKTNLDAENWYRNGISSSMKFYGIDITKSDFTAYFLPKGANSVTQVAQYPFSFDFNGYYAQPAVKLSSTQATAINQIVLQKYLACFENSGYEGYYNWRRIGVPAFESGSGVGNNGMVPKRWAYPVSEQAQNKSNWSAALAAQQFSADDLNQSMWLIK